MIREELDGSHYPGELETFRTTRTGLQLFLRPITLPEGQL
jgi:hypothetical protein